MSSPQSPASPSSPSTGKKQTSLKLLIIGSVSVGKTSIMKQYVYRTFDMRGTQATLGCDFCACVIPVPDGNGGKQNIKANAWDCAGMDTAFNSLAPSFFRGADGALLVYDITNKASFENATRWQETLVTHAGKVPVVLVGNKLDLAAERRAVPEGSGEKFMKESNGVVCEAVELTAGDHDAVERAFVDLAKAMLHRSKSKSDADMMSQTDIRRVRMGSIPPAQTEQPKKDCAC